MMERTVQGKKGIVDKSKRIPRISSDALLKDSKEIVIVHQNEEYRLRLTKNNRLLLTK